MQRRATNKFHVVTKRNILIRFGHLSYFNIFPWNTLENSSLTRFHASKEIKVYLRKGNNNLRPNDTYKRKVEFSSNEIEECSRYSRKKKEKRKKAKLINVGTILSSTSCSLSTHGYPVIVETIIEPTIQIVDSRLSIIPDRSISFLMQRDFPCISPID